MDKQKPNLVSGAHATKMAHLIPTIRTTTYILHRTTLSILLTTVGVHGVYSIWNVSLQYTVIDNADAGESNESNMFNSKKTPIRIKMQHKSRLRQVLADAYIQIHTRFEEDYTTPSAFFLLEL